MQRQHEPLLARLQSVRTGPNAQCAVDLASLLADASALRQLVADLFLPFEQMHVDQVVAVHVGDTHDLPAERMATRRSVAENKKRQQQQRGGEAPSADPTLEVHQFTSAIAGAIAGANHLAYGEMTVRRTSSSNGVSPKKRQRSGAKANVKTNEQTATSKGVSAVDVENCSLAGVKIQTTAESAHVLLVLDWIDEAESVLAARDAITRLGGHVVGLSFVFATDPSLLLRLKEMQFPFRCLWKSDADDEVKELPTGGEYVASSPVKYSQESHDNAKRQSHQGDCKVGVLLGHHTAQYQANLPGEDRSVNIAKTTDEGIQVNAVLDGHGGVRAVEFLRGSLCQRIMAEVSREKSSEEIAAILRNAFARCDDELKESLLALSPEIRMSKGYCNAGSCAVVALFIDATLYVANVGDCGAVVGRTSKETGGLQAVEVSVEHSCSNPEEVRLVVERSRDRNPVRLSKDDQANTGFGGFGVKRVAGSLAITRAFGDFYLKCEELSSAPFKNKVPYITVEPSVATIHLNGSEKYVILASDGLWEVMTPQEAVHIVDKFDPRQCLFFSTAGVALIHAALEKIAHRDGMMMHELLAKPRGRERRRFHDDITCTVVYIHPKQIPQQDQAEASHPQKAPAV